MKATINIIKTALLSLCLLCLCIFSGCNEVKSEYDIPLSFGNDFVAKIKVPDKTKFVGTHGCTILDFKTELSKEKVTEFYDDYFSSLQKVYTTGHSPKDLDYYYDAAQKMVFYDLEFKDNENDKVEFMISCDTCEDINNNEYWTTKKLY